MAFATSNVKHTYFGDLKVLYGDWTGAVGDANGSVTVKGGRVFLVHFYNQDDAQEDRPTPTTISVSSGTITISVGNRVAVTNGRFLVVYR